MGKILKVGGIGLAVLLVVIQFFRPERSNPAVDSAGDLTAQMSVPPAVRSILERSCYDCHSNKTRWPWYTNVAPVSWLVVHDVDEGRERLNFSEWGSYKQGKRVSRLDMMITEVDKGEMPLKNYLLMHGEAVLTEADKDTLCAWAERLSDSLTAAGK
jgi:hypothetical protein